MSSSPYISKSKFLWGLQCPKLLWHAYNAKDLIPEPDAATQAIFEQGHEVGALAKQVFPGGVEVGDGILDPHRQERADVVGGRLEVAGDVAGAGHLVFVSDALEFAALGLQAATGQRPLVLVGDGAFQMTGWELGNCRRYGWDPIVLLFNNASWEMLRTFQPESGFNDLGQWGDAEPGQRGQRLEQSGDAGGRRHPGGDEPLRGPRAQRATRP